MSVVIYRNGERELVEPHRLQAALDSGATLSKEVPKRRGRPPKAPEAPSVEVEPDGKED